MPPKGKSGAHGRSKQLFSFGFTIHELNMKLGDRAADIAVNVTGPQGLSYKTETKQRRTGWIKYEESKQWSEIRMHEKDFNLASLEFQIEKGELFSRNTVLGTCSIQLAVIRARKNKAYVMKNFDCLGNEGVAGTIRLTIFAIGPGDVPPVLTETADDDDDGEVADLNKVVQGQQKFASSEVIDYYTLYVQILRVEHLGDGELKYNASLLVGFNGIKLETEAIENVTSASFNKMFRFPARMPLYDDSISIRVIHKPTGMFEKNFVIAQGQLRFSMMQTQMLPATWFNLYGFRRAEIPDLAALAATGEHIVENCFLGRVLVAGRVQTALKKDGVPVIVEPAISAADTREEPETKTFSIMMDVLEIAGVVAEKAYVQLTYMRYTEKTAAVQPTKYNASGEQQTSIFKFADGKGQIKALKVSVPADRKQQADVILNLWIKTYASDAEFTRVGYKRFKFSDIESWEDRDSMPWWIPMDSMPNLGLAIEPGSVYMTLYQSGKPVKDRWEQTPPPRKKYQLRVYVAMARNLKTTSDRVPSPFVQVSAAGKTARTAAIKNSANPFFSEVVVLDLELADSQKRSKFKAEAITISVMDEIDGRSLEEKATALATDFKQEAGNYLSNFLSGAADLAQDLAGDVLAKKRRTNFVNGKLMVGRGQIKQTMITTKPAKTINPKWIKLRGGASGHSEVGDLLVDVELIPQDKIHKIPLKSCAPDRKPCTMFASILGLRNLIPFAESKAIQKPVLEFQIPSFSESNPQPYKKTLVWDTIPPEDVKTVPDDTNRKWVNTMGTNFEYCCVLAMDVELPILPAWDPAMEITLTDSKLGKVVGSGRFPLRELLPWNNFRDGGAAAAMARDEFYPDAQDDMSSADEESADDEKEEINNELLFVDALLPAPWNQDIGLSFDAADEWTFPPRVKQVDNLVFWKPYNIKPQDVLLSIVVTEGGDQKGHHTWGHGAGWKWTNANAQATLASLDNKKTRPLVLRFRTLCANESMFTLTGAPGKLGLAFIEDDGFKPPTIYQIANPLWLKAGIGAGYSIQMFDGIDVSNYTATEFRDEFAEKLQNERPLNFLMRAPKAGQFGLKGSPEETTIGLNGLPKIITLQKKEPMHPKITANMVQLNMRVQTGQKLYVQGFLKTGFDAIGAKKKGGSGRPTTSGELDEILDRPVFDRVPLFRGRIPCGVLKARCGVQYKEALSAQIPLHLRKVLFNSRTMRQMYRDLIPARILLRVYVLRAYSLVSRDANGLADPFLTFTFGKEFVPNVATKQSETLNPNFCHREDKEIVLPDMGHLEVGVRDYDGANESKYMGTTIIDLEDRWLSKKFQEMNEKQAVPTEFRTILNHESPEVSDTLGRGVLEMWTEMLDTELSGERPASVLSLPPETECEVRIVAWKARNLFFPHLKNLEEDGSAPLEAANLKLRCNMDSLNFKGKQPTEQETDIHYGAKQGGFAEYNWRFVYSQIGVHPYIPLNCTLALSLWNHELGWSGDQSRQIGQVSIDLRSYLRQVVRQGTSIQVEAYVPMTHETLLELQRQFGNSDIVDDEDEDDDWNDKSDRKKEHSKAILAKLEERHQTKEETEGDIVYKPAAELGILVEVMLSQQASSSSRTVGLGREEPNRDPSLEFPKTGRGWDVNIPGVAEVFNAISGWAKKIKRTAMIIAAVLVLLFLLFFLFGVRLESRKACTVLQTSCCDTTKCLNCAQNTDSCGLPPIFGGGGIFDIIQGGIWKSKRDLCLWSWSTVPNPLPDTHACIRCVGQGKNTCAP